MMTPSSVLLSEEIWFQINDTAREEIQEYFLQTSDWINSALTQGELTRVLVNCWQGASR